jgi:hypothetical protein
MGVKLTTYLQLVQRSKRYGSIHALPHTPSWHNALLVKHRGEFTFLPYHFLSKYIFCKCLLLFRCHTEYFTNVEYYNTQNEFSSYVLWVSYVISDFDAVK